MNFIERERFNLVSRGKIIKGDLLFCLRGSLGKFAIVDDISEGAIASSLIIVRPGEQLNNRYLAAYFSSQLCLAQINKFRNGAAQPNLSGKNLGLFKIPLPLLPEQKRIVAILDETFAGIDQAIANTKKNLTNAREVFESYLNGVFIQKDEGWTETSLVNEIELLTGFAFKSKGYSEEPNSIKLLRGDNIIQGAFRWESAKKWSASDVDSYSKYYLRAGDVVLAMDRTWVKAGLKYAQIEEKDLPCLLVQRVARLRPKSNLDSNFLKYLISSNEFTKYVLSIQTGSGVPHISGAQIKAFQFGKPTTAIQKKTSAELDKLHLEIQHLESIYQKKLTALAELKQSILHKAFTGELTQTPEQELAEAC